LNLEAHSINVLTKGCDNFPVWSPRGDLILFIRKIGDDFEVLRSGPTARMSGG
jgi:Tol biopolymer transport system component